MGSPSHLKVAGSSLEKKKKKKQKNDRECKRAGSDQLTPSPICGTGILLPASFVAESIRKFGAGSFSSGRFLHCGYTSCSAACCGDIKSPRLWHKALMDHCGLASAEAWGFISLLSLLSSVVGFSSGRYIRY